MWGAACSSCLPAPRSLPRSRASRPAIRDPRPLERPPAAARAQPAPPHPSGKWQEVSGTGPGTKGQLRGPRLSPPVVATVWGETQRALSP